MAFEPGTLRQRLLARRHTTLLGAIVVALALRPLIGDVGAAPILFSFALVLVMLVALYVIQVDDLVSERSVLLAQRKRRSIAGVVLALLAIAERVGIFLAPSRQMYLIGSLSWLLFFSFVTWAELRSVLRQKAITSETISMSISVYLLLALSWGLLYGVIFLRHPDAFDFGTSPAPVTEHNVFPVLVYFSLTTISTIGFGDITPVSLQARYAAVAEGITGQLYLAILVARLVGMQMNRSVQHPTSRNS